MNNTVLSTFNINICTKQDAPQIWLPNGDNTSLLWQDDVLSLGSVTHWYMEVELCLAAPGTWLYFAYPF